MAVRFLWRASGGVSERVRERIGVSVKECERVRAPERVCMRERVRETESEWVKE